MLHLLSTSLPALAVISFLNQCHSDWSEMESQYSFLKIIIFLLLRISYMYTMKNDRISPLFLPPAP